MGILTLMGEAAGALALLEKLAENPKGRGTNPMKNAGEYIAWLDGQSVAVGKSAAEVREKARAIFIDSMWGNSDPDNWPKATLKITRGPRQLFVESIVIHRKHGENPMKRSGGIASSAESQPKIRLRYFPTNAAWAFTFGRTLKDEKPIAMGYSQIFHSDRASAVRAAAQQGLKVSRAGIVGSTDSASPEIVDNPRGRSKGGITRKSQATGKRPSKRLVRRRKVTAKMPPGVFANPVMQSASSYGNKATKKFLHKRVQDLADALGIGTSSSDPGNIGLDIAYGGYRLVQWSNPQGGERDLSARLNAGEMRAFLDGAIMVARAVKK